MALKNAPSQKAKRKVGEQEPETPAKKVKVSSEATKDLRKASQGANAKCVDLCSNSALFGSLLGQRLLKSFVLICRDGAASEQQQDKRHRHRSKNTQVLLFSIDICCEA